jgi:hypothetical protein
MIRQCAWCLKMMGESKPLSDKSVTHGMCPECLKKMMKEVEGMEDMRKIA